MKKLFIVLCATMAIGNLSYAQSADNGDGTFSNPLIYADVPDLDIERVGDTYYMVSTTMSYSPGCTIMKSKDLVNWSVCGYAYDYLDRGDRYSLRNGQNDYANGSWAANIRYDKYEQRWYIIMTCNTTGKTYFYSTRDIEKEPWHVAVTDKCYDPGLLFIDNGESIDKYVIHPSDKLSDHETFLRHMLTDGKGNVGIDEKRIIIPYTQFENPSEGLRAEGYHGYKIGEYVYLFCIQGQGSMRQEIVWRTKDVENDPWEVRKVFNGHLLDTDGSMPLKLNGIAQGGIVSMPDNTPGTHDGTWYCYLFQDCGSVGRIPMLLPMKWDNDKWPVIGNDGTTTPVTLPMPVSGQPTAFCVVSDEFDNGTTHYQISEKEEKGGEFGYNGSDLKLEWQWNHNPDNRYWSLTDRDGWLRLKAEVLAHNIRDARNTLTQRTFGPTCSAETKLDASMMRDGDCAGLTSFQNRYGYVGVEVIDGVKYVVMRRAMEKDDAPGKVIESVKMKGNVVYLRLECDFTNRTDKAKFYYSFNGKKWKQIGDEMQMHYDWPDFCGQRMGVFCFPTKTTGGYADFDYFRIGK